MHLSKVRSLAIFGPSGHISKAGVWNPSTPLLSASRARVLVTSPRLHQDRCLHQSTTSHSGESYGSSPICKTRLNNNESSTSLSIMDGSEHLPKLPIPPLSMIIDRLKESISPVAMNSTEFVNTLRLIDSFAESAAPKLDILLRHKADQCSNWLTYDWWKPKVYLIPRQSIVININCSLVYPEFPFEVNNQRSLINFTAQLISSWIDYKYALANGYNPDATSADNEYRLDPNLCYNQYRHFFGSTRFPGETIDTILPARLDEGISTGSLSFIISFRGRFFEVQLRDVENEKMRVDKIAVIIHKILDTVDLCGANLDDAPPRGPGVLTATTRDQWAKSFDLMDPDAIRAIREAQFVVCLDTITDESSSFAQPLRTAPANSTEFMQALGRQVLHGDSSNVGNRWFDKLQLIVTTDESAQRLLGAGANFEHTLIEGFTVPKLIEFTYDKTVSNIRESSQANFFAKQVLSSEPAAFKQLRMFKEGSESDATTALKRAMQDFNAHVGQFDLSYFKYRGYGQNSIKSWRFSPGSWLQVAQIAAYYNLHKRLKPVYDSCTTRRFAYGRTELARSLTKEAADFCMNPNFETLTRATNAHKPLRHQATNGMGIDKALQGFKWTFDELKTNNWSWGFPSSLSELQGVTKSLQRTQCDSQLDRVFSDKELGLISAFFNDDLIERSAHFALTTVQMPYVSPDIALSCGPLMADGYNISSNISGQQIVAFIAANSENQSFSCEIHEYARSLRESLDTMRAIVEENRSLDK